MSVVVAIKKNDTIYIGADSQATYGGSKVSLNSFNNYKIWPIKGIPGCLMGAVGDLRDACAIRTLDGLVDRLDVLDGIIDYNYIVNVIEPSIRETLISHKFLPQDKPYDDLGSIFLFVYQDKMYTIVNGAVIEHDDYVAIGSGASEALGSLNSTESEENPNIRLIKAIKASAGHDLYVGYPIIITNSADNEKFMIVDEKTVKKISSPQNQKKSLSTNDNKNEKSKLKTNNGKEKNQNSLNKSEKTKNKE